MLSCYIVNLDRATERWENIIHSPGISGLNVVRVPAADGFALRQPYPNFSPWGYYFCHGRKINPNQAACYNSHLKALRIFLDSGQECAVICEDDVVGTPELPNILQDVLRYSEDWDFIRLTGSRQKEYLPVVPLSNGYRLISDLRNSTCCGSYLVNRRAAEILLKRCIPMRVNWDLAVFYGIPNGIREMTVMPFPVHLSELNNTSQIGYTDSWRYPLWHPYRINVLTVVPYRLFTRNWRTLYRLCVGVRRWFFPPKPNDETIKR